MIFPNPAEILESRIALSTASPLAPEISADGKSAKFVDVDGDVFTVTTNKGKFTAENFTYLGDLETGRGYLQKIDLSFSLFGKIFQGAKISVTVDQVVDDGYADVGYINASGIDLKQVAVGGDLVKIDVGDGNVRTPAIGLFDTEQLGFYRLADAGLPNFVSNILGGITTLDIGDWYDARIEVTSGTNLNTAGFGKIGRATIGSISGGEDFGAGSLKTSGSIRTLVVLGGITGGGGELSGSITSDRGINSLTIGGDLKGGVGIDSGRIVVGNTKAVSRSVDIGGSLVGGVGAFSGEIHWGSAIKSITVGTDVVGGAGPNSGSIYAKSATKITVGGALRGFGPTNGIFVDTHLGSLALGEVDGTAGVANIIVFGRDAGGTAIGRIAVEGSVVNARILAGYTPDQEGQNANARIGSITIGGDLKATDIVAGIDDVNGVFGDTDDQVIPTDPKPKYLSSISSIIVAGVIEGTESATDRFGIVAERIGMVKVGDTKLMLGKKTVDEVQLGTLGDYVLREVQV